MSTTTRLTALTAGLSALVATGASAQPCSTHPADVEYLEPPYTVEQLRGAMRPGLQVVVRSESPVAGNFNRRMVVEAANSESITLQESTLERPLRQAMPDTTVNASWAELRDHGCFPASATQRTRVTAPTPFGNLSAWRYEFEQGPLRLVLTFADALPGLPMSYQRFESGVLVLSSHQARRSDVQLSEDRP